MIFGKWFKLTNKLIASGILITGISLGVLNYQISYNALITNTENQFFTETQPLSDIIETALREYTLVSKILAVDLSTKIDEDKFTLIASNAFSQNSQAPTGYTYITKLFDNERDNFVQERSKKWNQYYNTNQNYTIFDFNRVTRERVPVTYPLTFRHPPPRLDQELYHLDFGSENTRRSGLILSMEYEQYVTPALIFRTSNGLRNNVVLITHFINPDNLRDNFVVVAIRIRELLTNAVNNTNYDGLKVSFYQESTLYDSIGEINGEVSLQRKHKINFAQTQYTLVFESDDSHNNISTGPIILSTVLTILFFIILTISYIIMVYNAHKNTLIMRKTLQQSYDKWMSYMMHSIRSPIHSLNYLSDSLILVYKVQEKVDIRRLEMINATTKQLYNLVNSYVDLTAHQARTIEFVNRSTDVTAIAKDVFHQFEILAPPEIKMNLDIASNIINTYILLDPLRLRQILSNGLSNAIKYTSKGTIMFKVSLNSDRTLIRFKIIDTGPGIKYPELLFKDFGRGIDPARPADPNQATSGLGLVICKHLSDRMNGKVSVNNRNDDKRGTVFLFEIPFEPTTPSSDSSSNNSKNSHGSNSNLSESSDERFVSFIPTPDMSNNIRKLDIKQTNNKAPINEVGDMVDSHIIDIHTNDTDDNNDMINVSDSLAPSHPVIKTLRVIAAEDDYMNRITLRDMLKSIGFKDHKITIFSDGEDIIEYMDEPDRTEPQLILLDIYMKRMNGDETFKKLKERGYDIPCIALTGNALKNDVSTYKKLGFADVLTKPYSTKSLKHIIKKIFF